MGAGASKHVEKKSAVHCHIISDAEQTLSHRLTARAHTSFLDQDITERWGFSGHEPFNSASLDLLSTLLCKKTADRKAKEVSFEQWVDDKSSDYLIKIQKKHINAVSLSIKQQQALPEGCLNLLDDYLEHLPFDFDIISRINEVSNVHAYELRHLAEEHQLVHHDLPHALEIEWRTMKMLDKLNIWEEQTSRDMFLRAIIACMIRLHDHEQNKTSSATSNEEVSAERVISWLNTALNLPQDETKATVAESAVKNMIQFMAHRIIVCGTTMIYSQKRTLDLIELLFVLEKEAKNVNFSLSSKFNQNFIENINITTILVGANDKNPGASLFNVLEQVKQPSMTTLPLIKRYYGEVSVLNMFFSSNRFNAYYNIDRLREHYHTDGFSNDYTESDFFEIVNKQAFLMIIVPHISMRPECLKTTDEHRVQLRTFIQLSRFNLSLDVGAFKEVFEKEFAANHIANIMNDLFFNKIDSEVEFSRSQEGGLAEMAEKKLPGMGMKRAEIIGSLIDPSVPIKDALHLKELARFYNELTGYDRIRLCKELIMVVILQAGLIKAKELGLFEPHIDGVGVKPTFSM